MLESIKPLFSSSTLLLFFPCSAFGAVAAFESACSSAIPSPEIRRHNLKFDLNAHGIKTDDDGDDVQPGFHLKIYGNNKQRYITLVNANGQSSTVKALKTQQDQSVRTSQYV